MRLLLICIFLFSMVLSASSIYDYFSQPTQEQVQKYYQDKSRDPLRYTYNPLQVGNKWFYSGWYNDGTSPIDYPIDTFCGREVRADSLINGRMHYYVFSHYTFEHFWEYNQGDSLMAYTDWGGPNGQYSDQLFWVFNPGCTFQPYWNGGWDTVCTEYGLVNLYGQTVNVVYFVIAASNVSLWAEMFGPLSHGFDFGAVSLDGCIIDGVTYGVVPNPEEPLHQPDTMSLCCYPNPFRSTVSIILEKTDNQSISFSIYNLKGQLVRNWNNLRKFNLTWDGTDLKGKPASPGIYLIKACSGNQTSMYKVIKLSN